MDRDYRTLHGKEVSLEFYMHGFLYPNEDTINNDKLVARYTNRVRIMIPFKKGTS